MSFKQVLLAAAKPRIVPVQVAGTTVYIREPEALLLMDHATKVRKDREDAMSELLVRCVVDENGVEQLTKDEAMQIVRGRKEVLMPIIQAITGGEDDAKNGSAQTADSSSD